ncbi:YceI family protein [Mucilaginibacter agri]|uniref:Polyisoprenoid-binding protein n=1 Tax=Mucilaginibacter agri TaxID=2695265 RepID=A0A965ZIX3_9SPHI|nr:YceI family protein [Mucilaginibacter agri]NCD70562.1 polyisoprenoid-binding protein [Mucilaginibacter agri]
MKKIVNTGLFAAIISFCAFTFFAGNWKIKESGASVKFSGGKISGSFETLRADIQFDKNQPEQAKISATIDVNSIATGFFIKTNHAKDALGADNYPTIKFVSTSVSKDGVGYVAKGNLTMKGATKPATIHFTFDDKGSEGVFKGSFKVIPKDYGIDRSGTPDDVTIDLIVPVTKA